MLLVWLVCDLAILCDTDCDPVTGFPFHFQSKSLSEQHLFWLLGFPARLLAPGSPVSRKADPLGKCWRTFRKGHLEQSPGLALGYPQHLCGARRDPLGQMTASELSHYFTRHSSLCWLIKMLSEEKQINDTTAPFFVVLFWNAINNHKVFPLPNTRPQPGCFFLLLTLWHPATRTSHPFRGIQGMVKPKWTDMGDQGRTGWCFMYFLEGGGGSG